MRVTHIIHCGNATIQEREKGNREWLRVEGDSESLQRVATNLRYPVICSNGENPAHVNVKSGLLDALIRILNGR